jgi:hypothetical protein
MSALGDEILRATGGPTINDGLFAWYGAEGGVGSSLQDRERSLLTSKGAFTGTNSDLWYQWLRSLGHTGSLNDMKLQFWTGQATPV